MIARGGRFRCDMLSMEAIYEVFEALSRDGIQKMHARCATVHH